MSDGMQFSEGVRGAHAGDMAMCFAAVGGGGECRGRPGAMEGRHGRKDVKAVGGAGEGESDVTEGDAAAGAEGDLTSVILELANGEEGEVESRDEAHVRDGDVAKGAVGVGDEDGEVADAFARTNGGGACGTVIGFVTWGDVEKVLAVRVNVHGGARVDDEAELVHVVG